MSVPNKRDKFFSAKKTDSLRWRDSRWPYLSKSLCKYLAKRKHKNDNRNERQKSRHKPTAQLKWTERVDGAVKHGESRSQSSNRPRARRILTTFRSWIFTPIFSLLVLLVFIFRFVLFSVRSFVRLFVHSLARSLIQDDETNSFHGRLADRGRHTDDVRVT